MTDRDYELDRLLSSLREIEPSELEEKRWLGAVKKESRRKAIPLVPRNWKTYAAQLTAAVVIGYFAGNFKAKSNFHQTTVVQSNLDATIEHVVANAE